MRQTDRKKVVVTGGAGFIGSHLADELVRRGYGVHVVDNLSNGRREDVSAAAVFHQLDILDTGALGPILAGAHAVFHMAALPRVPFSFDFPRESHDANINGTFSVLMAAREGRARRVIYAASSSSYGRQSRLPFTEDMRPNPASLYSFQKLAGEEYARLFSEQYGLPTVSLRFFNVYGPRMRPDGGYALVIPKFLALRKEGKPLPVTGDGAQTRDFTHVRDTVRACLLAMESGRVGMGEVLNISAGRGISINRLAEIMGGGKEYVAPRPGDLRDTQGDAARARQLLGWQPDIAFEDGIAELMREWGIA